MKKAERTDAQSDWDKVDYLLEQADAKRAAIAALGESGKDTNESRKLAKFMDGFGSPGTTGTIAKPTSVVVVTEQNSVSSSTTLQHPLETPTQKVPAETPTQKAPESSDSSDSDS